jgi:hypothetical protein
VHPTVGGTDGGESEHQGQEGPRLGPVGTRGQGFSRARQGWCLLQAKETGSRRWGPGRKRGCVFVGVWGFRWRAQKGVGGEIGRPEGGTGKGQSADITRE